MSYKTCFPLKGDRNSGMVVLQGSFRPNGNGTVDNTKNVGAGFTVARTGVGTFTITLDDSYAALYGASFQVQLNAAAATQVILGAVDVVTAKTIAITAMAEAAGSFAAADIASNANNRIFFTLVLKDSAVAP